MKSFRIVGLFVISFLLIFSSCSIEKKQYSSGYHLEWYRNSNRSEKQKTAVAAKRSNKKNNPISQINSSPKAITKSENKISNSAVAIQNPLSRANRIERNFFEKLNVLPVDSLKTNSQKINSDQKNDEKKWKQISILSILSIVLGVLLFVIGLSASTNFPLFLLILAAFLFVSGAVFSSVSSYHIKKMPMSGEEDTENSTNKKHSETSYLFLFMLILFLLFIGLLFLIAFSIINGTIIV